ncbi:DUF4249 domain-containing protein [Sabulibacter ruber]|uniref:DUF4249 domain-containing protein n=1 Tax=Sabulibacter ruber TaxID=2811901 RepID=UPI001A956991|nr:DUF4249 domain-containing protein [Sabulibacter ruber]
MLQYVYALFLGKQVKNSLVGIWVLFLAGALAGCETVVEVEVPEHTPKLAVQYTLNTDDPNKNMFVGRSQPVLSNDELWRTGLVRDASITIKDIAGAVKQQFVFTPNEYNAEFGNYTPTGWFVPEPGQQYTLTISAPNFETVQSTLTMPAPVPVVSTTFQPDSKNGRFNLSGMLRIQFNDLPNQQDNYRLMVQLLDNTGKPLGYAFSTEENDDIFGEEIEQIELYKVFDDGWANQGVITFSGKIGFYTGDNPPTQLEVVLQHVTRDLFLYERSKDNYTEDNPFAEPLNLYSNIQNGYGNFGGITVTKFRIRL